MDRRHTRVQDRPRRTRRACGANGSTLVFEGRPSMTSSSARTYTAPLSDEALMAKVGAGSVESFVDLYDRYRDRAYIVARAVCHDDGRTQEAVQDGFLALWNSRANYRPQQETVAAWLLTVVRYRAIDIARSNRKHVYPTRERASARAVLGSRRPVRECGQARRRASPSGLCAMLPHAQAEVITLAYYGRLCHAGIAAHLGLPTGTVKGRMRLGLQKLQTDINPGDREAPRPIRTVGRRR